MSYDGTEPPSSHSPKAAPDVIPFDTASTETISLESSEEEELSNALGMDLEMDVDAFEGVDILDLCSRPIGEQEKIVATIKQKERDRYNADRQTSIGKPEEFSKTHVGNYLKEAKFQLRLKRCRFILGTVPSSSDGHKVRRIATDAERCYIFERDMVELHQQLYTETKTKEPTKINQSIGRMLPGESIMDASTRLQKSKQSMPVAPCIDQDNDKQTDEIEWETISLPSEPTH